MTPLLLPYWAYPREHELEEHRAFLEWLETPEVQDLLWELHRLAPTAEALLAVVQLARQVRRDETRARRKRQEKVRLAAMADWLFFGGVRYYRLRHPDWTWKRTMASMLSTWESDCARNPALPLEERLGALVKNLRAGSTDAFETLRKRYEKLMKDPAFTGPKTWKRARLSESDRKAHRTRIRNKK